MPSGIAVIPGVVKRLPAIKLHTAQTRAAFLTCVPAGHKVWGKKSMPLLTTALRRQHGTPKIIAKAKMRTQRQCARPCKLLSHEHKTKMQLGTSTQMRSTKAPKRIAGVHLSPKTQVRPNTRNTLIPEPLISTVLQTSAKPITSRP